jgi:hypothetical protein
MQIIWTANLLTEESFQMGEWHWWFQNVWMKNVHSFIRVNECETQFTVGTATKYFFRDSSHLLAVFSCKTYHFHASPTKSQPLKYKTSAAKLRSPRGSFSCGKVQTLIKCELVYCMSSGAVFDKVNRTRATTVFSHLKRAPYIHHASSIFPFSWTCCIDTTHLKIQRVIRPYLSAKRQFKNKWISWNHTIGCGQVQLCVSKNNTKNWQKTKHYSVSLGYKIKAKITKTTEY